VGIGACELTLNPLTDWPSLLFHNNRLFKRVFKKLMPRFLCLESMDRTSAQIILSANWIGKETCI